MPNESVSLVAHKLRNVVRSRDDTEVLPLPVQTFPVSDDFRYEDEKQEAANLAAKLFDDYENAFLRSLDKASREVNRHTQQFFTFTEQACRSSGAKRNGAVRQSLDELLACSPKKILAEFQKQALVAGWAYVSTFNEVIDRFAQEFPRCRAGIYASRLKYSDVIQISEEILATIRSCSTLIDDLQRRYDLLESLQNNIQADVKSPELQTIMDAMKETFADNARHGATKKPNDSWFDRFKRKITGAVMQPVTAVGDLVALPALQIQGQMQRTRRMSVFLETSQMFSDGWNEWNDASQSIIFPNLKIMFELKRDYFRNQMLCLCDLVSYNGYELEGLPEKLCPDVSLTASPEKSRKLPCAALKPVKPARIGAAKRKAVSSRSSKHKAKAKK